MLSIHMKSEMPLKTTRMKICRRNTVSEICQLVCALGSIRELEQSLNGQELVIRWKDKLVTATNLSTCEEFFENADVVSFHIETVPKTKVERNVLPQSASQRTIFVPKTRSLSKVEGYDASVSEEFWTRWSNGLIMRPSNNVVDERSNTRTPLGGRSPPKKIKRRLNRKRKRLRGMISPSDDLIPSSSCPEWASTTSRENCDDEWFIVDHISDVRVVRVPSNDESRESTNHHTCAKTPARKRMRRRRSSQSSPFHHAKRVRHAREFLVKWKGWSKPSWEAEANLHPELVSTYMHDTFGPYGNLIGQSVRIPTNGNLDASTSCSYGVIVDSCSCTCTRLGRPTNGPHARVEFTSSSNENRTLCTTFSSIRNA